MTYYINCIGDHLALRGFLPGILETDCAYAQKPRTILLNLDTDITSIVNRNFQDKVPVYAQYLFENKYGITEIVNDRVIAITVRPEDGVYKTYLTIQ